MFHPIYGLRSLSAIPLYIIMAVLALCFGLLLKYAYKHNTRLADIMNKAFSGSLPNFNEIEKVSKYEMGFER